MNEEIESFLNYFDEHRVEIRFVDMPDQPPDVVWYAEFYAGDDLDGHRDQIVQELEEALAAGGEIPPHALDVKRTYYDWGASAAAQEIILHVTNFVLEQGKETAGDLAKIGMGAGLKLLWDRWRKRERLQSEETVGWNRDTAEAKARDVISRIYKVEEDDLEAVSDGHRPDDHQWTFEFGADEINYTIVLEDHGSKMTTVEINRRLTS